VRVGVRVGWGLGWGVLPFITRTHIPSNHHLNFQRISGEFVQYTFLKCFVSEMKLVLLFLLPWQRTILKYECYKQCLLY